MTVEQKMYKSIGAQEAAKLFSSGERFLILCHKNPDGDTVGSAAALREIIRALGAQASCACCDPIPERLRFIIGDDSFVYPFKVEDAAEYDRIVTVDIASPEQLGELSPLAEKTDLMIDHHSKGKIFAPNYIIPDEAAAGKLIYNIALVLKEENIIELTPGICRCMYAAIVSDTGGFKYSSVKPDLLRACADIMEIILASSDGGITPDEISRLLFDCKTRKEIEASRVAFDKLTVSDSGEFALCTVSLKDMAEAGLKISDFSNIIELPRTLAGVKVAVAIKESDTGVWRISARANGDYNVSSVCAKFDGGGHMRAAGGVLRDASESEAVKRVTDAFSAIL